MTAVAQAGVRSGGVARGSLDLPSAARMPVAGVLAALASGRHGLTSQEAAERLRAVGPNALRSHGARPLVVLVRQLRNPLLILLVSAALTSLFVGEGTDAAIIMVIICLSVGLGFFNEYRSERAVEALHSQLRHTALTLRDGKATPIDVTRLVPGDVVQLAVGDVVPADVRLLRADGLECDESVLTGESLPVDKQSEPIGPPESPLALGSCAFMGTVVRNGTALAVVVRTGAKSAFGAIAMRLGDRQPQTAFQLGLRGFSLMLVRVTAVLAVSILVVNVALGRSLLDSILFALAIAVGLTPQLLPAIVTVSLSSGARRLTERKVVVKRLVAIEDLGNIEVFFTDKTGTLTEGQITFAAALDAAGEESADVLRAGLLCNEAVITDGQIVGGNQLDRALWASPAASAIAPVETRRLAAQPFDYQRRLASVLVEQGPQGREIIVKGAPEAILQRCIQVDPGGLRVLERLFAQGSRVVAVARRPAGNLTGLSTEDERDLRLAGFLTFLDRPKPGAADALGRLQRLGVEVKVITGDNGAVAQKVCHDLRLEVHDTVTGAELDAWDDQQLMDRLPRTTIFARVTPEQKSRVIAAQRQLGATVGFLGDGVNDAVALHDADAGVSVQTATDVAKDAADVVLLDKDLGILADGIVEGRRIFSNTIKYVLMGTSSNFGNMFSAGGASFFLSFLPMLPTQILLNNLLYDVSEMTIPTDNVDEEQLRRPAHWDIRMIRRFMVSFGPISSIFDFVTFAIMIWVFDAHAPLFRSGWFVESLATQSLVIFAIRTRRVPFIRSRPSTPLTVATLACVAIGALLPSSPLAHLLGFRALPAAFFGFLVAMIVAYLVVIEVAKQRFYRTVPMGSPLARPHPQRPVHHRASRWSIRGRLPAAPRRHRRGLRPVAHQAGTVNAGREALPASSSAHTTPVGPAWWIPAPDVVTMSYKHDVEMTMSTATPEHDRLHNVEELLRELEELRGRVVDSLGEAAHGIADQAYRQRAQDTLRRLLQLDDELHVADFPPEWVVEFRGLLLDSVRALQTEEPLDAYDRLLLDAEAIRHLLRDAIDGHVEGGEEDIAVVIEQLTQWLPRVSQTEMAALMGISTRQFQRWTTRHAAPSRRAQLVARLVAILRRSWTPEGVLAWFHRPRPALDGRAPIDVLDDPAYERDLVLAVRQGRAQHGA